MDSEADNGAPEGDEEDGEKNVLEELHGASSVTDLYRKSSRMNDLSDDETKRFDEVGMLAVADSEVALEPLHVVLTKRRHVHRCEDGLKAVSAHGFTC